MGRLRKIGQTETSSHWTLEERVLSVTLCEILKSEKWFS